MNIFWIPSNTLHRSEKKENMSSTQRVCRFVQVPSKKGKKTEQKIYIYTYVYTYPRKSSLSQTIFSYNSFFLLASPTITHSALAKQVSSFMKYSKMGREGRSFKIKKILVSSIEGMCSSVDSRNYKISQSLHLWNLWTYIHATS